jgi:hypothetical protein
VSLQLENLPNIMNLGGRVCVVYKYYVNNKEYFGDLKRDYKMVSPLGQILQVKYSKMTRSWQCI